MVKNNELSQPPLVSVIITTYNRANVLKNAIDSVLNQVYPNIEIIVIDDGSEDDTKSLVMAYGNKISPIFKQHTGKSHSRNLGLSAAKGTIIATLDSDDIWHNDYLEKMIKYLLKNDLDIVFAACVAHRFSYQKHTQNPYHLFSYEAIRKLIIKNCPAPSSGVVMQRKIMGDGWHNASLEYEDWHLQIECIVKNKNCQVGFTSEILWEKREDEMVKNKLKTTLKNKERTQDTAILLNRMRAYLTTKEYNTLQQNHLKDIIRLLFVLIVNGEDKRDIFLNTCLVLSQPTSLIRMIFNVLKNRIK